MQTAFSTMPVNFQSGGGWQRIDNTLVAGLDGLLRNRADDYSVALPPVSGGPVVAAKDGLTVTSVLQTATGSVVQIAGQVAARASGESAVYQGVFPGVDELFTVRPSTLEQSFRLASPDSASSFTQSVTLTPGYTLGGVDPSGAIPIRNATGEVVGGLPAPVLTDSSPNPDTNTSTVDARYVLTGSAPVWTVTTVINKGWLASADRVFPVLLDPSTTFGSTPSSLGCYVTSPGTGAPPADPQLCASNTGTDNALNYGSTAYTRRIYLKFGDINTSNSPVPLDAVVTDAELVMTQKAATNGAALDTVVHQAAAGWNSSITWANQPGGHPDADHPGVGDPTRHGSDGEVLGDSSG